MNHRKAIRSHVIKRFKQRFNLTVGVEAITELKRQIREGEAIQLTKQNYSKKIHAKWQCFYGGFNMKVVFDDLHNTIMTVI